MDQTKLRAFNIASIFIKYVALTVFLIYSYQQSMEEQFSDLKTTLANRLPSLPVDCSPDLANGLGNNSLEDEGPHFLRGVTF